MNTFRQQGFSLVVPWMEGQAPDIFVSYVGLFQSTGDFLWEQIAPTYIVHVIRKGAGVFDADGRAYPAKAGDLFVFHPGMYIRYHDCPESPWHYTWFRLDGPAAGRYLEQTGLGRGTPFRTWLGNADFETWLTRLEREFPRGVYSPLFPAAAATALLEALSRQTTAGQRSETAQLAQACRMEIENRLAATISVDELAARFRVNRSTLFRVFRQAFHMSPKDYIDTLRFEKANALLERTQLSIKEVAAACGFDNADYFCAAFRKRFGVAPSAWRQHHGV